MKITQRLRRGQAAMAALGVAALGISGAACSSEHSSSSPSSSTTASTAPAETTTTVAAGSDAVAAYRAFWEDFLAASDPMDPESPRLAEHATGEQLAAVRSSFLAAKAAGNVIRGTYDLAPRIVSAGADTVVISDCYDDQTGVYSAANGARQEKDDPRRHLVTATVKYVDGVWKVAAVKHEGDGCLAS